MHYIKPNVNLGLQVQLVEHTTRITYNRNVVNQTQNAENTKCN